MNLRFWAGSIPAMLVLALTLSAAAGEPPGSALRAALAAVPESDMLIFEPEAPQHILTVFTDVDCPRCRRLHAAMDEFLAAGIRVRYLFYPLQGPRSASFDKAEAVWCADDSRQALTRAMRGETVKREVDCDTPVMSHLKLAALTLKLPGTPGLIAEDGRRLSPALTPDELIREITATP